MIASTVDPSNEENWSVVAGGAVDVIVTAMDEEKNQSTECNIFQHESLQTEESNTKLAKQFHLERRVIQHHSTLHSSPNLSGHKESKC